MPIRKFALTEALSAFAFIILCAGVSAPARADVAIEAVWQTPDTGDTAAGQKLYVSGTHVRIDNTGRLSLVLYDGTRRFTVGPTDKQCRAQAPDSLRQFAQSVSDAMPRVEWKVKSLDQTRDIGRWKCRVYQVYEHRLPSKLSSASKDDHLSKEICVVPYSELPNGDEVRRASQAITLFMAPMEPFGDSIGIIEQTTAVSAAVNGFVVALKPFPNGDERELIVKGWNVDPIAKDVFTPPAGCVAP